MNRHRLIGLGLGLVVVGLLWSAAIAAEEKDAPALSPDDVIKRLKDGNERYVSGKLEHPNVSADRRTETAKGGQHPYVTLLSCADSRVPTEFIFDAGIGDLFVMRVAGNVADTDEVATIEYGVEHLKTPLLLVLGHTRCGAVTAAATNAEAHGNIPALVAKIKPAVAVAKERHPELDGEKLVAATVETNVWEAIDNAFKSSPILREAVHGHKAKVVGAIYDIETGQVRWLGEHPEQTKLLGYTTGPKAETAAPSESKKHGP